MPAEPPPKLSRREREIMDVVYRLGTATAADIAAQIPDPPSYSAVRALVSILVKKGHLTARAHGTRHQYAPAVPRRVAQKRVLRDLVMNFFSGSPKQAVMALLDESSSKMDAKDLEEIRNLLEQAHHKSKR